MDEETPSRRAYRSARRRVLGVSIAIGALGCQHGTTALEPLPSGGHHVLFIGNSLTYVNDLPATVAAIAAAAGDTVRVMTAAGPNLALIDHLNGATNAVAAIRLGGWEYVVLQQGPTPRGICRDSLVLWTTMFDPHIRAVGARAALLMTWPAIDQQGIFDDVRISFLQAAQAVGGVFLPAGEAWRTVLNAEPGVALYGPDGFHPSSIGTYLGALVVYERVTGRDARTLPAQAFASGQPFTLAEPTVRMLQEAAHSANARYTAEAGGASSRFVSSIGASC